MSVGESLADVSALLSKQLAELDPGPDVTHVMDPTVYARRSHEAYCSLARPEVEAVLLGMNPGPWGMAQTGVPFGEVDHVRNFLGIDEPVERPPNEHPKRPVLGFDCPRSEVSGRRLWTWGEERFGTADAFFRTFFVWNWCPLCFMESGGRNRTPDKLSVEARRILEPACDAAVRNVVRILKPRSVIGVGAFAAKRASKALAGLDLPIHQILHPSPASPAANRGWAPQVERQLQEAGYELAAV